MTLKEMFGYNHRAERDVKKALRSIKRGAKLLSIFYRNVLKRKYHIVLGENVVVGDNLKLPHPQNIVFGIGTVIGNNCVVYQDVTFGKKNDEYPTIGNNVVVYPGAKVLGGITVGDNAVIGANAVVIKDVPRDSIVGGVPAQTIRKRRESDIFS